MPIYNASVGPQTRVSPIPVEIVDAFRAIAPTVETFARDHELLIDRYRRGKAAWELRFGRQLGGEAVITISYRERTGHVLDISATWWIDDRERRTRRLRSEKVAVYDRRAGAAALRAQLEQALAAVDDWTLDDLGPPRGPFPAWTTETTGPPLPRR
jgi:hypothetical protein